MRRHLIALSLLAVVGSACTTGQALRPASLVSYAGAANDAPAATASGVPKPMTSPRRDRQVASMVAHSVAQREADLQFCRDQERASNAAFAGTAKLEVTLAEDGYVLRARVLERDWNADGAAVEDCMLQNIRRWRFPETDTFDKYVHAFAVKF